MASEGVFFAFAPVWGLLSALIALLDVAPLVWHIKNKNLAAATLAFWLVLLNLLSTINAIIWPTSQPASRFSGDGVCDVQAKLILGASVGLPSALTIMMRNLAYIMEPENAIRVPSRAQKMRALAIDIGVCCVVPLVYMACHYVAQPSRFYVYPVTGCDPSFDESWPSLVLVFIWPTIFSLSGAYYAVVLLVRLRRYRQQFNSILSAHSTTKSRFTRLVYLSLICIVAILPTSFYILLTNLEYIGNHYKNYSWSRVHDPATFVRHYVPGPYQLRPDRIIRVVAGLLVFVFFGMGQDAVNMYRRWLVKLGLGKVFPGLLQSRRSARGSTSTSSSVASSVWRMAKHAFTKHKRDSSVVDTETGATRTSVESASTGPLSAKSHDSSMHNRPAISSRPPPEISLPVIQCPAPVATAGSSSTDGPYEGLPKRSITASASGEPPSPVRPETSQSGNQGIFVTKAVWQEVEPVKH